MFKFWSNLAEFIGVGDSKVLSGTHGLHGAWGRGGGPKGQNCKFVKTVNLFSKSRSGTVKLMLSYIVCRSFFTKNVSEEYKLSVHVVQGVAQLGPWEGNGGGGP